MTEKKTPVGSGRILYPGKILYHGTGQYHKRIDLRAAGDPFQDFGRGYYLTSYRTQAALWARHRREREKPCYIMEYEILPHPDGKLRIRELLRYDREWLDFIAMHRIDGYDPDLWDIVYDRMADSRGGRLVQTIQRYRYGTQSRNDVEDALSVLRFPNTQRDQYCFKTETAISFLRRTCIYQFSGGRWHIL